MDHIRVFIVEEEPCFLQHQIRLLAAFSHLEIVGTAQSFREASAKIALLSTKPNVVLCDFYFPSSIKITKHIKAHYEDIEVLIFSTFDDEKRVLRAIEAGACGYLLKGANGKKIYEAIIDVFFGRIIIEPRLAQKLLKFFLMPRFKSLENINDGKHIAIKAPLTLRELECLQIVAKGLSNHEAASVLNLSKATIRTHLEHIYQKLDVSNRVEAITEGVRQGIIVL